DRVGGEQAALVEVVDLGNGLVVEGGNALRIVLRGDELVLGGRDLRVDAAGDEPLRVPLELLETGFGQPDLVGLVVDREVGAVAEPRRLAAEDPAGRWMKREDPDCPG